jgi:hypothetical protein
MGVIVHRFVSGIADGGDATLVRPVNWNESHSISADASVTIDDGELLEPNRFILSGTNRLTLVDTGRLILFGFTDGAVYNILGNPKVIQDTPFRIPNGYAHDVLDRLTLLGSCRAIIEGNADLYITDDARSRSRFVLAGRG